MAGFARGFQLTPVPMKPEEGQSLFLWFAGREAWPRLDRGSPALGTLTLDPALSKVE